MNSSQENARRTKMKLIVLPLMGQVPPFSVSGLQLLPLNEINQEY